MSAIIYARVSTERQAQHDLSIPGQLRAMRAYVQTTLNKEVVDQFEDVGSGRETAHRPGLLSALKWAGLPR